MDNLKYCLLLREKGLGASDLKKKLEENGVPKIEWHDLLRESDKAFLSRVIFNRNHKVNRKREKLFKIVGLVFSILLLTGMLFGYIRIGIITLLVIWAVIGDATVIEKRKRINSILH